MVLFIVIGILLGAAALGIGYWIGLGPASPQPTAYEQAAQALGEASAEVDDLFHEARIRMEEMAGKRRPGERRLRDGLRSSWRDW
jgi:hypothetical protein